MERIVIPDRRATPRHPAVGNHAFLVWLVRAEVRRFWARLLNGSCEGALLATERPLPPDQPIWLRLEEPTESDWVSAKVVRHDVRGNVGVSFRQSCLFFVNAVTSGIDFEGSLDPYWGQEGWVT
jgi:hypothetical protein